MLYSLTSLSVHDQRCEKKKYFEHYQLSFSWPISAGLSRHTKIPQTDLFISQWAIGLSITNLWAVFFPRVMDFLIYSAQKIPFFFFLDLSTCNNTAKGFLEGKLFLIKVILTYCPVNVANYDFSYI